MWESWNPLSEMESLHKELDRFLHGYRSSEPNLFRYAFLPGRAARSYPLINVYERENDILVEALAPGLNLESLELSLKGRTLTIAGEKQSLKGVEKSSFHRNERAAGKFARQVELEEDVDESRVQAEYKEGILSVTLPKDEKAKPRKISVKVQ